MCVVMVPLLLVLLGGQAATSLAAGSAGSGTEARRPGSVPAGKLVAKYTTADSDTYVLPNGHMLTRVYDQPINQRDAAGQWQPLTEKQSAAAQAQSLSSPALSATPDAERNPLGQEDEAACTLTSTTPTTSACNELTFKAGYETSGATTRHALLSFALPDLHEEETILSAQLELYAATTTTTTSVAMGAYRVTSPWAPGATWNTTNGSTPWTKPGGDYANPEKETDAAVNPAVGTKTGWAYWYPTRMVQEWYNGPDAPEGTWQPDLGFLLKDVTDGATNNTVTFDGHEERERDPGLAIEWVQRGVGNSTKYTQVPIQLSSTQTLQVNPASGNLMIHSNDLAIASKGLEFDSSRSWNSLANEAPGYGYGWVDSNAVYVQVATSGNVAYTEGAGNTFPFIKEGSNFRTPTGIEATMCEAKSASPCPTTLPSGTTYQLIYTKTGERINFGHKESFEPFVYYYVASVEDPAGEKQTAQYTGSMEYPTSWIDTEKTEIAYTESAATGYTKITAKTNPVRSTSYVEPEGEDGLYHLTVYTNEKGEKTTYRYGGESYLEGNLLTEITEPNGNVTKLFYNSDYQIVKLERFSSGQKTGSTTTYTYYEASNAPSPCTYAQKGTVITGPEGKLKIYCSNFLDEVEQSKEIEADKTPPVFESDFEASAYLNPTTKVTTLYFQEATDPALPDGEPGSGVANYTYRYRVNNGAFSSWQSTSLPEVEIAGVSAGATILIEVYATDYAGNVSATVSASAVVPPAGEGNGIGEENKETEPAEPIYTAEGITMSDSEKDGELEAGADEPLTGMQPAFTKKRDVITHRATVRGNENALVIGTATPKMTYDVKYGNPKWLWGKLYKNVGACGWVETPEAREESNKDYNNYCPASRGLPVKSYTSLINCDSCDASTSTAFEPVRNAKGEAVNTNIPVFANVRPFTTEHPYENFATISTVVGGKVQTVGWRYITRSGKYALISASVTLKNAEKTKVHQWAFIESKYLRSGQALCVGDGGSLKSPDHERAKQGWPDVCKVWYVH
jgi:hypothetical protein